MKPSTNLLLRRVIFPCLLSFCYIFVSTAQETKKRLPIIDVHVHAMGGNPNGSPMCPWFLKDMPGGDPNQEPPVFMDTDCINPLQPARSDAEMDAAILRANKELNITMVVSGDAKVIHRWHKAAPDKIIPSLAISNADQMTVEAFRDSLSTGFYKVMGEVAPQYQGMSPSDMSLDEYFGVAEELGIPVGILYIWKLDNGSGDKPGRGFKKLESRKL